MKTPASIILLALGLCSCESGPNARTGTAVGALGGAAAGGIIGHQSGRGLEGAAIGAGAGALAGNAIGGAQDRDNGNGRYLRDTNRRYYERNRQRDYRSGYNNGAADSRADNARADYYNESYDSRHRY